MPFTYDFNAAPLIAQARLLASDTDNTFIPLSGTCNTNGTAVQSLTGAFASTMPSIVINGVVYTIAAFVGPTSITLASSAGVQNGVGWSSSRAIFDDVEVQGALNMTSTAFLFVSAQSAPTAIASRPSPLTYSVWRAAAALLRALAANRALLATIMRILDVSMSSHFASQNLRACADDLLKQEQTMGQFAIAEMVSTQFAARERVRNMILRIEGGG